MTGRSITAVVLVMVVGLVTGACGGGEETLTKAEYVEQANAICAASNAEIEAVEEEMGEAIEAQMAEAEEVPSVAEFAQMTSELISQTIPILEATLTDLRALPMPEGDEDTLTALYNDFEQVLADLSEQSAVLTTGDEAAINQFYEVDYCGDVNERTAEYGLTVCAEE